MKEEEYMNYSRAKKMLEKWDNLDNDEYVLKKEVEEFIRAYCFLMLMDCI